MHHFKWTDSVLPRLTRRVLAYSSGDWYLSYPPTIRESQRMLKHLEANGGRIDVTAGKLALYRCGSDYADYGPWTDLVPVLVKPRSYAPAASQTASTAPVRSPVS